MSVQIFGSTLFNFSQVVQEFFSLDFWGTLKGKSEQSGNEHFCRGKEEGQLLFFFSFLRFSMCSVVASLAESFTDFPCLLSQCQKALDHLHSTSEYSFQWLLQRIWCVSWLSFGSQRVTVSVSPALVVLWVKGHNLSWRSSLWSAAGWQYNPLSWQPDLLASLFLSLASPFWWSYKVANTCNFLYWLR